MLLFLWVNDATSKSKYISLMKIKGVRLGQVFQERPYGRGKISSAWFSERFQAHKKSCFNLDLRWEFPLVNQTWLTEELSGGRLSRWGTPLAFWSAMLKCSYDVKKYFSFWCCNWYFQIISLAHNLFTATYEEKGRRIHNLEGFLYFAPHPCFPHWFKFEFKCNYILNTVAIKIHECWSNCDLMSRNNCMLQTFPPKSQISA